MPRSTISEGRIGGQLPRWQGPCARAALMERRGRQRVGEEDGEERDLGLGREEVVEWSSGRMVKWSSGQVPSAVGCRELESHRRPSLLRP